MSPPLREGRADLIILGGGCAGLSLAARLVQQCPETALVVVEPRTHYEEDRTWCGWRTGPHFFSDCVVAEWDAWHMQTPERSLLLRSSRYPYERVHAGMVYEKARRILEASASATLLAGVAAERVNEADDCVEVGLTDGRVLQGPWVVDTRPRVQPLREPWLWQNFVGYVVEGDLRTGKRAEIPTLMEFQAADGAVAQFQYTIPFGGRTFLCECTRFSRVHGEEAVLEAALVAWLNHSFPAGWSVRRREAGSLPMAPSVRNGYRRVVPAGTRGGSMRISTGYAFHRIQRWADACANSFLRNGRPVAPATDRVLDFMDELFLRVLQQPSTSAADLFVDLFAACPTDRLIRFLAGTPRLSDLWPVAAALPWGSFLREIPRLAGARFRGSRRPWPGRTEVSNG